MFGPCNAVLEAILTINEKRLGADARDRRHVHSLVAHVQNRCCAGEHGLSLSRQGESSLGGWG